MDTRETSLSGEERRAEMLERSIAERRQRINRTLDEIGERVKPRHLLDELLGRASGSSIDPSRVKEGAAAGMQSVSSALRSASDQLMSGAKSASQQIRRNAWPAAALGAGAAWWIYNEMRGTRETRRERRPWSAHLSSTRGSTVTDVEQSWPTASVSPSRSLGSSLAEDYRKAEKEKVEHVAGRAKAAGAQISDKTTEVSGMAGRKIAETRRSISQAGSNLGERGRRIASDAGERGRKVLDKARERAHSGREALQDTFHSSPLLLGAAAAAVGFVAGLMLPRTRKEDELIGDTSDRFGERLKQAGEGLVQQGNEAVRAASETVQGEMRSAGEQLKEKSRELKEHSQDIAKDATERSDRLTAE